ncbi:MAG TPA: hypothetical protein VGL26_08905 [Jatrophihabitans sp.]
MSAFGAVVEGTVTVGVDPNAPVTVTPDFATTGASPEDEPLGEGDWAAVEDCVVDGALDDCVGDDPELEEHAPKVTAAAAVRTTSAEERREPLYTTVPSVSSSVGGHGEPNCHAPALPERHGRVSALPPDPLSADTDLGWNLRGS